MLHPRPIHIPERTDAVRRRVIVILPLQQYAFLTIIGVIDESILFDPFVRSSIVQRRDLLRDVAYRLYVRGVRIFFLLLLGTQRTPHSVQSRRRYVLVGVVVVRLPSFRVSVPRFLPPRAVIHVHLLPLLDVPQRDEFHDEARVFLLHQSVDRFAQPLGVVRGYARPPHRDVGLRTPRRMIDQIDDGGIGEEQHGRIRVTVAIIQQELMTVELDDIVVVDLVYF
mmetsp:Transcript_54754/g.163731  ORF Transcript_54754/g.163731 Transcript_54754/m.163731 type:complete len:224 (+) Transcript_54754:397-1068(+)